MTNYEITIGYKAVLVIKIKAIDEKQAKEKALEAMKKVQDKINSVKEVSISDDNYKVDGILDMDETWNMVQN
jgi:putative cell wall-binding protein